MSLLTVIAAPGLLVPKEHKPRDFINDAEPVEITASAYYLRMINEGDLVLAPDATPVTKPAPKTKGA